MATSTDRIRFVCTSCGYRARIPAKYEGQTISCPGCQKAQEVVAADSQPSTGMTQEYQKPTASAVAAEPAPTDGKFRFVCNTCSYRARIPVKYAGMAIKCPGCGTPQMAEEEADTSSTGGTVEIRKVDLSGGGDRFLFQCPSCGYRARLPTSYQGQQIKCPGCHTEQTASAADTSGPSTGNTVTLNKVEAPIAKPIPAAAPLSEPAAPAPAAPEPTASASGGLDLGSGPSDGGLQLDDGDNDGLDLNAGPADEPLNLGGDDASAGLDLDSGAEPAAAAAPSIDLLSEDDEPLDLDAAPEPIAAAPAPTAPESPTLNDDDDGEVEDDGGDLINEVKPDSRRSRTKRASDRQSAASDAEEAAPAPKRKPRSSAPAAETAPAKSKPPMIAYGLAGVFLIAAAVLGFMWNSTKTELTAANDTITALEGQLADEQQAHDTTKGKLASEQTNHGSTRNDLSGERDAHGATKGVLTETKATLSISESNLASAQQEVSRLKREANDLADKQLDAERRAVAVEEQLEQIKAAAEASERRLDPALIEALGIIE